MIERKYNTKLWPMCFDQEEIRALEKTLDQIKQIAVSCVEINIGNYDESQVEEINTAIIDIHTAIIQYEKECED